MNSSFHTCGLEWFTFEEAINELADIGYAACGPILGPGYHIDPDTITDSQKTATKTWQRNAISHSASSILGR